MKYYATINRRVHYVKTYRIVKRISEDTNFISKLFASVVDRILQKKKRSVEV